MPFAQMDLAISRPILKRQHDPTPSELVAPWLAWSFAGSGTDVSSPTGLWSSLVEIDTISKLGEDWDGYGAARISDQATKYATDFLMAAGVDFPAPDVVPNSNGTISLGWQSAKNAVHLEIGAATFFLSIDQGGEPIFISDCASELGRTLAEFIAQSLYPRPSTTATSVQFAAKFRRAA